LLGRRGKQQPEPDRTRYCDVVMKGGIASGVTYPLAMCELAKAYRFRNIGGTSTGAIAAAFTAAAEHGRQTRRGGFDQMTELPEWFGKPSGDPGITNLLAMFKPAPETAPLFRIFLRVVRSRFTVLGVFLATVTGAVLSMPITVILGALPGLLVVLLSLLKISGVIAGLVLGVLGLSAAVLWRLGRIFFEHLGGNFYGICTGAVAPGGGKGAPLTTWLMETLDRLAGRNPGLDRPLTFGDLWDGPDQDVEGVNLRMMTTNLTQGRPMSLPFEDPGSKGFGRYYFHPDEMRRLFPDRVVNAMVAAAPDDEEGRKHAPLLPLPLARDLPVAFGVRLSLSYPLLLSAVPLYTIDWTRELPSEERVPERCWFTDGGITSNFPVHFFDQPLPRWPTFAVNLRPPHPDLPDVEVWMPRSNRERGIALWNRFDGEGENSLTGFLRAIKDVAQNWMDNEQARIPGYRDRIVHITLRKREGGINLNMPPKAIRDLADRGRRAGAMLAERFATGPEWDVTGNWDTHRWVRFRSTMHVLEELLHQLREGYRHAEPDQSSYADLAEREIGQPPRDYPWANDEQRLHAVKTIEELVGLVESWGEDHQTFDKVSEDSSGPPEPYPILRVTPRI
jgi:predicted acylesterase/phospholipase RssA